MTARRRRNPGDTQVTLTWTNPSGCDSTRSRSSARRAAAGRPERRHARLQRAGTTVTDRPDERRRLPYAIWAVRGTVPLRPCGPPRPRRRSRAARPGVDLQASAGRPPGRPDLERTRRRRSTRSRSSARQGAPPRRPDRRHARLHRRRTSPRRHAARRTARLPLRGLGERFGTRYSALARDHRDAGRAAARAGRRPHRVGGERRVDLSWTNPTIRFDRVIVAQARRSTFRPSDGTTLVSGVATSYSDTDITIGTTTTTASGSTARASSRPPPA